MPPLPDEQIAQRLAQLPGWARAGDEIVKTFELPTFPDAIAFVARVAERAEAADHHPDLDIRYRKVRVALSTHDAGGITAKDFTLAAEIDATAGLLMIIAVVSVILFGLALAVVIAIARDHGPTPGDVAVAYELAWDRLDFDVLYTLSAAELRDGRDRPEFVESKRLAYENQPALRDLVATVAIDQVIVAGNAASVATRVALRDGSSVRNRIDLARRNARWQVVAYQLTPGDNESPALP